MPAAVQVQGRLWQSVAATHPELACSADLLQAPCALLEPPEWQLGKQKALHFEGLFQAAAGVPLLTHCHAA